MGGRGREEAGEGETAEILLETTPFYAESGGQVSDTGAIFSEAMRAEVGAVSKPGGEHWFHAVRVAKGRIRAGDFVTAEVDSERGLVKALE